MFVFRSQVHSITTTVSVFTCPTLCALCKAMYSSCSMRSVFCCVYIQYSDVCQVCQVGIFRCFCAKHIISCKTRFYHAYYLYSIVCLEGLSPCALYRLPTRAFSTYQFLTTFTLKEEEQGETRSAGTIENSYVSNLLEHHRLYSNVQLCSVSC